MTNSNRRDLLRAGFVTAAALAVGRSAWASVAIAPNTPDRVLFTALADHLIPDTDTKGAVAAGVPDFLIFALQHGLLNAEPNWGQRLAAELERASGFNFTNLSKPAQFALLTKFDQSHLHATNSVWPGIKRLIVIGYYTSEIGGSEELIYDLVPGRYDSDVPYKPDDRALSNDWDGNSLR